MREEHLSTEQEIAELRAEIAKLKTVVEENAYLKDYIEIWQLTSYYTHIYHMLKNEECPALFAQRVPDVSIEVFDSGVFEGIEAVRTFFKMMTANTQRPGWMQQHLAVNPVIKIAKDRMHAKALWHSPGIVSRFRKDKLTAYWNWAKYDMDYIKEDGAWKFHKVAARLTFQSPYHKGWFKEPVASSSGGFVGVKPTRPTTYHMPYNPYRINVFQPDPPIKPFE
jgi:hypothetical protein